MSGMPQCNSHRCIRMSVVWIELECSQEVFPGSLIVLPRVSVVMPHTTLVQFVSTRVLRWGFDGAFLLMSEDFRCDRTHNRADDFLLRREQFAYSVFVLFG